MPDDIREGDVFRDVRLPSTAGSAISPISTIRLPRTHRTAAETAS
jgi:hypothetical protein